MERHEIVASAPDREALLVAWLNEFVYRFDAESLLFRRFDVHEMSDTLIRATAHGEKADPSRHPIKTGVKSTTYHGLYVKETHKGWRARVIFDI